MPTAASLDRPIPLASRSAHDVARAALVASAAVLAAWHAQAAEVPAGPAGFGAEAPASRPLPSAPAAPANSAAPASAVAVEASASIPTRSAGDEAMIRELENRSWAAWKMRDGAFFERVLSEDHVDVHAHGLSGKSEVVAGVRSPECVVRSYTLGPYSMTVVTADSVLVTYRAEQDSSCAGRKVASPVWAASLYARRGGRWLNVMYSHTPVMQN